MVIKINNSKKKGPGPFLAAVNGPPRTNYGCHKRSPPAITGPGRTIRGKIIVKKKGPGPLLAAV